MRTILLTLMVLAAPMMVSAQESVPKAWGYAFGGVGGSTGDFGSTALLHFGGGGEGRIWRGLGAGAEVGYLLPARNASDGVGLLSTNVEYHFVGSGRSQKVVPFVTGGFSLAFRQGSAGGGNFGGGVNYWMKPRLGLRLEFRDHIFSSDSPHILGFRVGLSFR